MKTSPLDRILGRLIARSGGRSKLLLRYTEQDGFHLIWHDHLAETLFNLRTSEMGELPVVWEGLPGELQSYLAESLPESNGEAVQQLRPYTPNTNDRRQYQVSLYYDTGDDEEIAEPVQFFFFCFQDTSEWIRESQETLDQHKLESIGELASGVAHDFNNLIMGIQSNAEALLAKGRGLDGTDDLLVNIIRACSNGTSLTRSLLGYAKRQPLSIHQFDLGSLINDVSKIAGITLSRTSHRLRLSPEINVGAMPILVEGCYSSLSHCILNLIKNAREAMPNGGSIEISSHCDDTNARLMVRDYGTGISEDEIAHIFEPFFSTKQTGTGLGLSMVRGIMSQHSGFVEIASTVGEGTAITLIWPRHLLPEDMPKLSVTTGSLSFDLRRSTDTIMRDARAAQAKMNPPKPTPTGSVHKKEAWVIDDDELVREGVEALLGHLKYSVTAFPTAEEAIAQAEASGYPALVLCDYNMPGMNGADFIRVACKEHLDRLKASKTRILLVSGFPPSEFQSLTTAYADMDIGMLQKPFSMQTLQKKLANFDAPRKVTTHIKLPPGGISANPKSPKPISAHARSNSAGSSAPPKIKARVRPAP